MNNLSSILLLCFFVLSCNQNPSHIENGNIKNLEKRIETLEIKIREINSKTDSIIITQGTNKNGENSENYFTIGSSMDKVLEVMGEPSSYLVTAPEARKFYYGLSAVYFYKDKVISYDNLDNNLKVRVK